MCLTAASLDWATDFVLAHADGDLFPKVLEIEAVHAYKHDFIALIEGKDLAAFPPGAHRRFIVPKDATSYRQATQLDPQDSILLTAVVHQFGLSIENRRLPRSTVFSYRFEPTPDKGLYGPDTAWNAFWTKAFHTGLHHSTVLYCDIADFYNQIYHHTVENQLVASGLPNQATKWVIKLIESTTAGVSRGVPIGPHGVHLIAEAALIPIDNSMASLGLKFLRFSDDLLIFCESEKAARQTLGTIATILDKQQRLMVQQHKTRFLSRSDLQSLCRQMIEDRPVSEAEDGLLRIIRKYSGGDPYRVISYNQISHEDWEKFDPVVVGAVVRDYVNRKPVDFIRLRWFYRRLTQVGHPGAVQVSLDEMETLSPCLANICTYLSATQGIGADQWRSIGAQLLTLLETDELRSSEFFRLSILSLFSRNASINHFFALATRFQASDPHSRREILLAAKIAGAGDWLREHKESFDGMDAWQKLAFMFSVSVLPTDEKRYFLSRLSLERPFEKILAKWAKNV